MPDPERERRAITEEDVFAAADAISQTGAKPSVSLVQKHLGRGSNTTIIRHLNVWWALLPARLTQAANFKKNLAPIIEALQRCTAEPNIPRHRIAQIIEQLKKLI